MLTCYYRVPAGQETPPGADQDPEAGLLQDVDVVVVGVPHGPAAGVTLGLLTVGGEHESAVTVSPLGPRSKSARNL